MYLLQLKIITIPTLLCLLIPFSTSLAVADESNNYFIAGLGFISSSKQDDVLKETYSDYKQSGGGSMINIDIGYSFGVTSNLSIIPKINYAAYRAEFKSNNFPVGSTKSNDFFIPGVSVRYNFSESKNSFYISGHLGKNSASSDFSRVNSIESDGVVTGVSIGYIVGQFHFEIGTMKIPVLIDTDGVPSTSLDFGGTYFTIKRSTQ